MKIFINIKKESIRVPNKNFRELEGVPLWEVTLRKLANTEHEVYVDTDSSELVHEINLNKRWPNIRAYARLPEHRTGEPGLAMFNRFVELYGVTGPVVIWNVTAPFLDLANVENAYSGIYKGYDSVIPIIRHRNFMYTEYNRPINHDNRNWPRTQGLDPVLEVCHAFYVVTPQVVKELNHRVGFIPYFYHLSFPQNIDIDTEDDWKTVVALQHYYDYAGLNSPHERKQRERESARILREARITEADLTQKESDFLTPKQYRKCQCEICKAIRATFEKE